MSKNRQLIISSVFFCIYFIFNASSVQAQNETAVSDTMSDGIYYGKGSVDGAENIANLQFQLNKGEAVGVWINPEKDWIKQGVTPLMACFKGEIVNNTIINEYVSIKLKDVKTGREWFEQIGQKFPEFSNITAYQAAFDNTSIKTCIDYNKERYFYERYPLQVSPDGNLPTPFVDTSYYGTIAYYDFRNYDYIKRNPGKSPPAYYINFGQKNLDMFYKKIYPDLTSDGKYFLSDAAAISQKKIEDKLNENPKAFADLENDSDAFQKFAFKTYRPAYCEAGWNDLSYSDRKKIYDAINIAEFKKNFTETRLQLNCSGYKKQKKRQKIPSPQDLPKPTSENPQNSKIK